MITALVLACLGNITDCNFWTAERHAQISVPERMCTMAGMQWAAQTDFLKPGEALKIECRNEKA